jgi:protein ImuB
MSAREPLWLCLYLSALAIEVQLRGATAQLPSVVVSAQGREQRVFLVNALAAAKGVCPGMPLGAAHALAELRVLQRDPAAEQAALERMAAWSLQFTPWVSVQAGEAVLLEIGASLALFGGLQPLLGSVGKGLNALGYQARLAVAPTAQAALCLCRADRLQIISERSGLTRALHDLPLETLGLPRDQLDALAGMGLHSLGDCRRLPRDGLARRIDPRLVLLLDRAWGRLPDPRPRFEPPASFSSSINLIDEVTDSEALLFSARRLLAELCGYLRARCAGVQRLHWRLHHRDGELTRFDLGTRVPSRDDAQLLALLKERLQRLSLDAAVRCVALEAGEILVLADTSQNLAGIEADTGVPEVDALYARLTARLGVKAVYGLDTLADHRPEQAWRACPPGQQQSSAINGKCRPLWLLLAPRRLNPIDGRPALGGPLHLQANRERIESGWWDQNDCRRDYYLACNPYGEWFWIFRDLRAGDWYLHGVFE